MMYPRDYRGMDVVSDTRQEKRKGCSCIGVLVTLIVIGLILIVPIILTGEFFFFGVPQEIESSALDELLSTMVLVILLLPVAITIAWVLNRKKQQGT